jgi:hypothetical protein
LAEVDKSSGRRLIARHDAANSRSDTNYKFLENLADLYLNDVAKINQKSQHQKMTVYVKTTNQEVGSWKREK